LVRALVAGAVWALVGGMIAFVLLPVYLYGVQPWDYGFSWRIIIGSGSPGAPSRGQMLQAAVGFGLLGAILGFVGGFLSALQRDAREDGD
jgi:hypothetical protein